LCLKMMMIMIIIIIIIIPFLQTEHKKTSQMKWFVKHVVLPLHPGRCNTKYHTLKEY
jgi:hypothetical protein